MKTNTLIRLAVAAGILWFATGGKVPTIPSVPSVPSVYPYVGPLAGLHTAARGMDSTSRLSLAETLDSAATMIESDKAGAIKTTEQLQAAIRATIAFGYSAFAETRYPAVAAALQEELEKSVGNTSAPLTPEVRSRTISMLREAAKAVR